LKGTKEIIAPKKATAVSAAKVHSEVSKTINEKNEEMLRARADRDVGKRKK
jgi:hypothetical protein